MFSKLSIAALLAIASSIAALPQQTAVPSLGPLIGEEAVIDKADYPHKHGAIAHADGVAPLAPSPTTPPQKRAASQLVIEVINKFGKDVYTRHAHNQGGPGAISGNVADGVLKNGASAAFAVPTGWAGNIAVVENGGGRKIVGDESLIEGSFVAQAGVGSGAIIDVDVSYVSGFSVPIVCSCDEVGHVVTGCNKNLWGLNSCPNDNRVGSCKNPQRTQDFDNAQPSKFFATCAHQAFTVPRDPGANANNICTRGVVRCCIGTSCPGHP
ncbi:hypothetical protein HYALB_00007593 [Hymenoscyphus albidus]|uniref:Uncharacterized protein n=1 Tax=Hymenoscyphus albidus TaxID=595503 RepID=A0A9N9LKD6_9HELO|nr:hypothetical protein HYALB_00007593 [Hymenoscyphus albidus]